MDQVPDQPRGTHPEPEQPELTSSTGEQEAARYLIIVTRQQPALADCLRAGFSEDQRVQVVIDRRVVERRQPHQAHQAERRQADRRRQPVLDKALRFRGYVVTYQQPQAGPGE